jgi:hypothetical protein
MPWAHFVERVTHEHSDTVPDWVTVPDALVGVYRWLWPFRGFGGPNDDDVVGAAHC